MSGGHTLLQTVFDELGSKEFLDARQRSNPFETIKGVIFQNRLDKVVLYCLAGLPVLVSMSFTELQ